MRLAEIMTLRQDVCAGVLVTLTERCPLHCAHCSFSAGLRGRHLDADALLRFVGTCTPQRRPDLLMLTGGEPLLRPALVEATARAARASGTRTAVLTGAFFARGGEMPGPIRRAAQAVDHLSLSIDVFHEREVAREDVFGVLRLLLRDGIATSLHVTGAGADDPYLAEVTAQVHAEFGADVPMLVSGVQPIGRAASWASATPVEGDGAAPCATAAWPVIAVDGAILACCNQDVVDARARPDHLVLGDITTTSWPEVHEQAQAPVLRMIRTVGPVHITNRANSPARTGYCGTCHHLADVPGALDWAERTGSGPVGELLQAAAIRRSGGPEALLRRHGISRYAHLVGGDS
ncbi:radical SAM protein [Lentzea sp. HUAS TT2]|uniref:radical SAM protein n=1 Tax=Lentzea sp. HUAS TT2 TaxID=3447454 RepID=UPI003F6FB520